MTRTCFAIVLLSTCVGVIYADDAVSFRREVVPILTKHGCATGACHGSPSGKGGFRLSLRGFDPEFDADHLVRESLGRRVNPTESTTSLLLRKPLMTIPHGGGRKLRLTDPGYDILNRWIAQGCQIDSERGAVCTQLVLSSYEATRQWSDVRFGLRVTARFNDGTERDVTPLADFTSTDEAVIKISAAGDVEGIDRGQATIIARYMDQLVVAPITILRPVEGFAWSNPPTNNEIDRFLFARQQQLQIVPSELCTDGEFIRRLYLDVLGVLPTADETRLFLRDSHPTKRASLIDAVLERDEYPQYWALKWGDLLQLKASKLSPAGVLKFHEWLVRAVRDNIPYDRFAAELLLSKGSTYENPPANFFRAATDDQTCSESVSQVFLGIRMQCAKCHNHPYERWTQDTYYGLAAVFRRVQRRSDPETEELTVWVSQQGEVTQPRTGQVIKPRVPFDGELDVPAGSDRRESFVNWLVRPDNPFFAKVGVNRIWGHVMGRGLVEPVDDFRDSNPASHPQLLDWLAREFASPAGEAGRAAGRYDQKHILRLILNSRTYQISSRVNAFNERDGQLFSHANARPLSAEPLLDAICSVTGVTENFAGLPAGTRATQLPSPDVGNDFLKAFGQPARNTVCDCERSREPKLSQTLQLLSGELIQKKLSQRHSRLTMHLDRNASPTDAVVDPPSSGLELWLRADKGVSSSSGANAVDGDTVGRWQDQSPHGRTVVQREPALRPTFVSNGIRTQPALRFQGKEFLHSIDANLVETSATRTVILVGQASETSAGGALFTFRRSPPVCTLQHILYAGTYYVYSDGVNGSGNSTIPTRIDAIRRPFVTAFVSAGAGHKLQVRLNSERQSVTQPGAVGADTGTVGFTIGQREDYPGFGWNGLISEVLVYSRELADNEMIELSEQLSKRYGVGSVETPAIDPPTRETESLDRAFLTELYLAAFSRLPSEEELDLAVDHLKLLNDRREGLGDLMWAVLNSKEFLFQH